MKLRHIHIKSIKIINLLKIFSPSYKNKHSKCDSVSIMKRLLNCYKNFQSFYLSFFFHFVLFDTGIRQVALVCLELALLTMLALNFQWSSCLCLLSAEMTSLNRHTQLFCLLVRRMRTVIAWSWNSTSLRRPGQESGKIKDSLGLQGEFKASRSNSEEPCLKIKNEKEGGANNLAVDYLPSMCSALALTLRIMEKQVRIAGICVLLQI